MHCLTVWVHGWADSTYHRCEAVNSWNVFCAEISSHLILIHIFSSRSSMMAASWVKRLVSFISAHRLCVTVGETADVTVWAVTWLHGLSAHLSSERRAVATFSGILHDANWPHQHRSASILSMVSMLQEHKGTGRITRYLLLKMNVTDRGTCWILQLKN